MTVIDASFQIKGSLLCLKEVSNMTLSGTLNSNDSSLSSQGCILYRPGDFLGFSAASYISITLGCNTIGRVPVGSYMYTLLKYLDSSSAFSLSVDATLFPSRGRVSSL